MHINKGGDKPDTYSLVRSETGRVLAYKHTPPPEWLRGGKDGPSPTHTANYPVQSMATGDIAQTMLWVIGNTLQDKFGEDAYLVNTVHDSYLISCKEEVLDDVIRTVVGVIEATPVVYEKVFGSAFSLPLKADYKVGQIWGDMK